MLIMEDKRLLITLNFIPKLGPVKIQSLTERYNNYYDFLNAKTEDLMKIPGIGKVLSDKIVSYRTKIDPDEEIKKAAKLGINIVTILDEDYPKLLKKIYDPPPVLYIKGDISYLNKNSIAIVGARKASNYGKNAAIYFAKELALMNINIVSGMARGIDSYAHKGALDVKGTTTAVLGCGLDVIYPPENGKLMSKIIEQGCIISTFPIGTQPTPANFPARNRIISGLSLGTVVIEAAEKSGSLITADFALEQGREVFAVPGSIFSPYSKGTHRLIKQGAKLTEDTEDILEELYLERLENINESCNKVQSLSPSEKTIFELIDYHPSHIEQIINLAQSNSQKVNAILTRLELKGFISSLPGCYYVRN